MPAPSDPYAVLGVRRGASEAEIHAAYRAAVRRTHPDAGGDASAFESVQEAYDVLRGQAPRPGAAAQTPLRARPHAAGAPDAHTARANMEDLLAEAQRLEDEARRLAGLPRRYEQQQAGEEQQDSFGAVLRDAGEQLRDAAEEGAKEVRRFLRRMI